jgi:hypothetical protein
MTAQFERYQGRVCYAESGRKTDRKEVKVYHIWA